MIEYLVEWCWVDPDYNSCAYQRWLNEKGVDNWQLVRILKDEQTHVFMRTKS